MVVTLSTIEHMAAVLPPGTPWTAMVPRPCFHIHLTGHVCHGRGATATGTPWTEMVPRPCAHMLTGGADERGRAYELTGRRTCELTMTDGRAIWRVGYLCTTGAN